MKRPFSEHFLSPQLFPFSDLNKALDYDTTFHTPPGAPASPFSSSNPPTCILVWIVRDRLFFDSTLSHHPPDFFSPASASPLMPIQTNTVNSPRRRLSVVFPVRRLDDEGTSPCRLIRFLPHFSNKRIAFGFRSTQRPLRPRSAPFGIPFQVFLFTILIYPRLKISLRPASHFTLSIGRSMLSLSFFLSVFFFFLYFAGQLLRPGSGCPTSLVSSAPVVYCVGLCRNVCANRLSPPFSPSPT